MKNHQLQTILSEGLELLKNDLNTMPSIDKVRQSFVVADLLWDLIEDPLESIEDMVGYADELKDDPIIDLNPLQRAIASLHYKKQMRKYINRSLRNSVLSIKNYKDLFKDYGILSEALLYNANN